MSLPTGLSGETLNAFYLHGFASSPQSSKAAYLAEKLKHHGIDLHAPDFNLPDFSTLTITRMIGQVGSAIDAQPPGPAILIGSSLGAFVAVQVALARPARVDRVVLLAPALDLFPSTSSGPSRAASREGGNRMRSLGGPDIDEWKRTNRLAVFHYAYGRMTNVHYELYADARRYDCINARLSMPVQIFQGSRDDAVEPAAVQEWAKSRPGVELHMLDDDHQLAASLDDIWREMRRFLSLT